jgi:hypothetical protein
VHVIYHKIPPIMASFERLNAINNVINCNLIISSDRLHCDEHRNYMKLSKSVKMNSGKSIILLNLMSITGSLLQIASTL